MILMLLLIKDEGDTLIYVAILTFSSVGSAIPNWLYIRKYCRLRFTLKCDLKKHLKPILLLFAISAATVIYVNVDATMIKVMKGSYDNGIYSAAVKVYNIFKNLVSAIIIVTVPRLSAMTTQKDSTESKKLMKLIFNVVLAIVLPLCLLSGLLSKDIILFIASKKYIQAGNALKILSVSLVFSSMASFMTTSVLLPNGKEKYILRASVISAVVNFTLNFWFIPKLSFIGAAITTMLAEFVMFTVSYMTAKQYIDLSEMKKDVGKYIAGCVGIIVVWIMIGKIMNLHGIVHIMVVGVCCMLVYILINLKLWKFDWKEILGKVKERRN